MDKGQHVKDLCDRCRKHKTGTIWLPGNTIHRVPWQQFGMVRLCKTCVKEARDSTPAQVTP